MLASNCTCASCFFTGQYERFETAYLRKYFAKKKKESKINTPPSIEFYF